MFSIAHSVAQKAQNYITVNGIDGQFATFAEAIAAAAALMPVPEVLTYTVYGEIADDLAAADFSAGLTGVKTVELIGGNDSATLLSANLAFGTYDAVMKDLAFPNALTIKTSTSKAPHYNVAIDGCAFNNTVNFTWADYGNANATVSNSTFVNTVETYNGFALTFQGGGYAEKFVFCNNTVTGYQRGINLTSTETYYEVYGNTISTTYIGRSAVQFSKGARCIVQNNTITSAGNAFTFHDEIDTDAKIVIVDNTINAKYLVYDVGNGSEIEAFWDAQKSCNIEVPGKCNKDGKETDAVHTLTVNLPTEITDYVAWDDATPIWKKGALAPQADFTGLAADDIVYLKPACTAPTSEQFELEAAPADSAISYTVKAIPYAVLTVTKDENVTTVVVTNQLGETVESGLKVRADAGVTVAVDESKLVFAEGYELDAELSKLSVALTADATISVVAKKSGGWHPDPSKDAGKTAEEAYGIPPASKLAGADAVALGNWAAKNKIDFAAFQADPDSFYDAFLLDTTKAGVEEAKKAFKITSITQDSEGNWIVKVTGDKGDEQPYNANALVDIVPYTGIEAGDGAGFFQATLKPIPPTK